MQSLYTNVLYTCTGYFNFYENLTEKHIDKQFAAKQNNIY